MSKGAAGGATRTCTGCGERKSLSEFGRGNRCRRCHTATKARWAKKNRERKRKLDIASRNRNRDLVRVRGRMAKAKDRERLADWYVVAKIREATGLPTAAVPRELIEARRVLMLLSRIIRQKETGNEQTT